MLMLLISTFDLSSYYINLLQSLSFIGSTLGCVIDKFRYDALEPVRLMAGFVTITRKL